MFPQVKELPTIISGKTFIQKQYIEDAGPVEVYGIEIIYSDNRSYTVHNVSPDGEFVKVIIRLLKEGGASFIHLADIIDDILAE